MNEALSILEVLQDFVRKQEPGATLDWLSVESATGVCMDRIGRSALRRACRRERRSYENIPGRLGLLLSSAVNACQLSRNKLLGVAQKAERARKFSTGLLREHDETLSADSKQQLVRDVGINGSVRMAIAFSVEAPVALPSGVTPDASERVLKTLAMARKRKPETGASTNG